MNSIIEEKRIISFHQPNPHCAVIVLHALNLIWLLCKLKSIMTKLSVNINKIAVLRNARGGNVPDVLKAASDIERFGAEGITVHPRPDERHIRYDDVVALKDIVKTELNVEGYPSESFMELIAKVKPHQVTLVPDPPGVLTSNAGWDVKKHLNYLQEIVQRLKQLSCRVSIFLEPDPTQIPFAKESGTDRIELYTEHYAKGFFQNKLEAIKPYVETAQAAREAGLGINAGHDLNINNLAFFHQSIEGLDEVSIGHALIADALYFGLENTVQLYLRQLK
jgi:pyridoxine 5-phosphate synthase